MPKNEKISLNLKATKSLKTPCLKKDQNELTSHQQKVSEERGRQYNHPKLDPGNILENFTNIGVAWGAIISSNFGYQTGPIPPHVVSHMMVSLKTMRAVVPSSFQADDIDDMSIYCNFSGRLDPQNPEGDDAINKRNL